ncbi:RagB/SusD family nutrient uptake outer membrane protein [Flavihumibacter solisilvae]|nr:RagB/SusD family nutrient uptake outer membrane protein [Flavihumibacter solisilvae]
MKKARYIITLSLFSLASIGLDSCSKNFLDKPLLGNLTEDVLATEKGVTTLLIGTYAALDGQNVGGGTWESSPTNWIYGSVAAGDAHKGSDAGDQPPINLIATGKSDPTNGFFNAKWRANYEGISRANAVLRVAEKATDMSPETKAMLTAEARFLRGHYYFDLKKMFNMVPWIDETTTEFKQPNTEDIWSKIEADFQFAYDNLGDNAPAIGRVNKWAAAAYLGKTLLFEKKFGEAIPVFTAIIANGKNSGGVKYGLTDRFEDNFDPANKNNKETVFAVQMVAKAGTGDISSGNAGEMLNFPYGDSPFGCCGFYQPTVDLVNSYRTDADGLPFLDTYNSEVVKHDQGVESGTAFTTYTGRLDPRLDWTAGRRGIPYKDWGNHPGKKWIRDQNFAGPYAPKKNVYWQVTQDKFSDRISWAPGSAINIHVIRYADVLLMAAEAEAQAGSLANAMAYVNQVRERAGKPETMVYKYNDDTDPLAGFSTDLAANYVVGQYPGGSAVFASKESALKAIYFERKLELAMEGHRYFDLVRWGIAPTEMAKFFTYESQWTSDIDGGTFTANKNEYYPIPQAQMDLSSTGGVPTLTQNQGY